MVCCIGKIKNGKLHLVADMKAFGKVGHCDHFADAGKMVGSAKEAAVAEDLKWCPILQALVTPEECAKEKSLLILDCLTCEEF